jgi:hypothetical protein
MLVRYHEPQAREAYEFHFWEYIDGSVFDLVWPIIVPQAGIFLYHILSAAVCWYNDQNITLSLT